jgi:endoglucanase
MQTSHNPTRRTWSLSALLGAALLVASCGGGGGEPAPVTQTAQTTPSTTTSKSAAAMAAALGAGVNFGNIYEAPRDNDWGIPFSATSSLTPLAKSMGFKSVRLPVRWSNHASGVAPFAIDPAFMANVKATVQALTDQGLLVVLNMHHYRDLDGDTRDPNEAALPAGTDHSERMVQMWKQIADEFKGFSNDKLLFEIYNEPHGKLQTSPASANDPWNSLLARALGQIRATNPERAVVVGPTGWNSAYNLQHLRLPKDNNLIVTIHQYEPFNFTHQGASWISPRLPTGQTCCSDAQKKQITDILTIAKNWSTQNGYPIYVGEFGAYSNDDFSPNMTTQRVNFNAYMRDEMARLNFSWAYWEMASGFGVYNLQSKTERTQLLQSLIPAAK